jgi:guanosine-3',5'-bis(diphosphate) 3'-pyrophosphohydrolase
VLRQYELVEKVRSYDPDADEGLINRAYVFSMKAHGSQMRASGDPYFSHPIEVAGILTDLKLDDQTIATAILHDTIEDTLATPDEIERLFGKDVARLVDGVTKLSKIEAQSENERAAENLRARFTTSRRKRSGGGSRARRWISMPRSPSASACTK